MPMILRTDRFKGNLLDLLGKKRGELSGLAPPEHALEKNGVERLIWRDMVEDGDSGEVFPIFYMVRLYQGEIFEVGIYGRDHLFLVDFNENGSPFFAAVPKAGEFHPNSMNWVRKKEGQVYNTGAV